MELLSISIGALNESEDFRFRVVVDNFNKGIADLSDIYVDKITGKIFRGSDLTVIEALKEYALANNFRIPW